VHRFSNKGLIVGALLIAHASFVVPASAADAAQEHVRRGVELRKDNRDRDALREFQEEAYALSPTAGIRAQIGLAEQALGEWMSSESDLRAALQSDDPWIGRNREVLDQALEFVNSQLGWVHIHCNVNGAEFFVSESPVGRAPTDKAVRVAAGSARVRIQAEGYLPAERSVPIEARGHSLVDVVLMRISRSPQREDVAFAEHSHPLDSKSRAPISPLWGFTVLGVGTAALGVGAALGVMTLSDKSSRDAHCAAHRCDPVGLSLDAQARREATASTIASGLGVVFLGAGSWLLWRSLGRGRAQTGIRIVPFAGPHGASMELGGVW
jgi:PEGA domain